MEKITDKKTDVGTLKNGIYLKGIVISNSARKVLKKDGTTGVSVKHEVSIDPGVALLTRFLDPSTDNSVKIEGDDVKSFPELKKFDPVTVRVNRFSEYDNQFQVSDWESIG